MFLQASMELPILVPQWFASMGCSFPSIEAQLVFRGLFCPCPVGAGLLRVTGRFCHGLNICHARSCLSCATSGQSTTAGAAALENTMAFLNLLIKLHNPKLGLKGCRGGGHLADPRRIWLFLSCSCSLIGAIKIIPCPLPKDL